MLEVEEVVTAAKEVNLANLGGQPQFRFPDGTFELYWLNVDSTNRYENEPWSDYVHRSAKEVRSAFQKLIAETNFVAEAQQSSFLIEKLSRGEDILSHLYFVLYFEEEKTQS